MDIDLLPKVKNRKKLTGIRSIIAKRMRLSLDQAAQAVHVIEIDMSFLLDQKNELQESGRSITITDMLIKAVALSLAENPILNSELTNEELIEYEDINISLAVAVNGGLLTPVIRNADRLSLEDISARVKDLSAKAKSNKLVNDDLVGGTFTISNLGMYGLDLFIAIINPPQAAILAIGAIKKKPVVNDQNDIVIKPMMSVSLSYDHRIVDGAPAAEFLRKLKEHCEGFDILDCQQ